MIKTLERALEPIVQKYNFSVQLGYPDYPNVTTGQFELYDEPRFNHLLNLLCGCGIDDNNKPIMYVSTLIAGGLGGSNYNRKFFPLLRRNKNACQKIENFYKGCIFEQGVRLNNFQEKIWFWSPCHNSLESYLKIFDKIPITRSYVPTQTCIDDLTDRNKYVTVNGNWDKLKSSTREWYHWLERLTIIERLDGSSLTTGNVAEVQKVLESIIEKHIHGMELINSICPVK